MTISKILLSTLAVSALAIAAPATAKIATGSNVSNMTVVDSNGTTHNLSDLCCRRDGRFESRPCGRRIRHSAIWLFG